MVAYGPSRRICKLYGYRRNPLPGLCKPGRTWGDGQAISLPYAHWAASCCRNGVGAVYRQASGDKAEQASVRAEANRQRSEAQKGIPKSQAKQRRATSSGSSLPADKSGKSSSVKAVASGTNRGSVERMDKLAKDRPDPAEKASNRNFPVYGAWARSPDRQ
jgi:hypothetical protein